MSPFHIDQVLPTLEGRISGMGKRKGSICPECGQAIEDPCPILVHFCPEVCPAHECFFDLRPESRKIFYYYPEVKKFLNTYRED